jgi:hypothetical protein
MIVLASVDGTFYLAVARPRRRPNVEPGVRADEHPSVLAVYTVDPGHRLPGFALIHGGTLFIYG